VEVEVEEVEELQYRGSQHDIESPSLHKILSVLFFFTCAKSDFS